MRDQHVLITGGSSGIGLALARQAAAAGARLSLIGRDPDKLAAASLSVREAAPATARIVTVTTDVAHDADLVAAIRSAEAVHGPVDVLITSAGVAHPGYFEDLPVAVFERAMAVNFFGTLYAVKAVTPSMRARRSGTIVLISSGAGLVGLFGYTAYAPSKFALRGLAESLRAELKPAGVGVTIVYPPDTDTPQLTEENQTKPEETKALTAAAGLWSAEAVARVTLAGVRRGRFQVTPGLQLTVLAWLHSLIAPMLRWSFDRTSARVRRKPAPPTHCPSRGERFE
jgi:3-dehydrosphinganine reductase